MLFIFLIATSFKIEFSRQILIKTPNLMIHENLMGGSQVVPCGWMCGWMDGWLDGWGHRNDKAK
jgi:hypothetical protein